jgi:hypothetical protein
MTEKFSGLTPKLVNSEVPGFHAYENDPSKVVRTQTFDQIKEIYGENANPEAIVKLGQDLFTELNEKYSIPAPVKLEIVKNEKGENVVHIITDKIEGVSLDNIDDTPEIVMSVEKLYTSIAKYYNHKLHTGGAHLADISAGTQYIYGKKKGDISPKIYLVDTDLFINKGYVGLLHNVKLLVRHMPFKNLDARKNIEEILNAPLPEDLTDEEKIKARKEIKEARAFLNGTIKEGDEVDNTGFIPNKL